jgi:SAM-dependent methyltransferase
VKSLDAIMRWPLVYRLWMKPFADKKFVPILSRNDLSRVRRVLDVGCGPGTNAPYFAGCDYLGIDLNQRYIEDAKRRYQGRFQAIDAAEFVVGPGDRFDFILVNSFLHHIETRAVRGILANLAGLLTDDGHVHIIDLVLPRDRSLARLMARLDRGDFPRPIEKWSEIFREAFQEVILETYPLGLCGVTLWQAVYFKGRRKI